jgi:vacuolar-type H+-ATPase subunit E/Vma4
VSLSPDSVNTTGAVVAAPLVERLLRDADVEVNRRVAAARDDAASRVEAARAAAFAEEAASVAAHRRTLTLQARVATESRSQAATRLVADARWRAVTRVLGAMSTQLADVAHRPDEAALIEGLIREVTPYLPDGVLRARASRDAVDIVRSMLPRAEVVEDEQIACGAVISDREGRLRIDATLHGRLARAGAPLAIRIATLLDAQTNAAQEVHA